MRIERLHSSTNSGGSSDGGRLNTCLRFEKLSSYQRGVGQLDD